MESPASLLAVSPDAAAGPTRMYRAHQLLFRAGAVQMLLALVWWALRLANHRWPVVSLPTTLTYTSGIHGIVMLYQVLPAFLFGCLLTLLPRWMGLDGCEPRWHRLIASGFLFGTLTTLVGSAGSLAALAVGAVLTLAAWVAVLGLLVQWLRKERQRTWQAVSCTAAVASGALGAGIYAVSLYVESPLYVNVALKIGTFGVLVPLLFSLSHRWVPALGSGMCSAAEIPRARWTLVAVWLFSLSHLWQALAGDRWLWGTDALLAGVILWQVLRWRMHRAQVSRLHSATLVGSAWLSFAFVLYTAQSLGFLLPGRNLPERAADHALFIGYFGSLVILMVMFVIRGDAERAPLLWRAVGIFFVGTQLVVVLRVVSEVAADPLVWQVAAGLAWLLACLPWASGLLLGSSAMRRLRSTEA